MFCSFCCAGGLPILVVALEKSREVACEALLALFALMEEEVQPPNRAAEVLLAQMQAFGRCSGLLRLFFGDVAHQGSAYA